MSDDKIMLSIIGGLFGLVVAILVLMAIFPPKHSDGPSHGCIPIRAGKVTTMVCH